MERRTDLWMRQEVPKHPYGFTLFEISCDWNELQSSAWSQIDRNFKLLTRSYGSITLDTGLFQLRVWGAHEIEKLICCF